MLAQGGRQVRDSALAERLAVELSDGDPVRAARLYEFASQGVADDQAWGSQTMLLAQAAGSWIRAGQLAPAQRAATAVAAAADRIADLEERRARSVNAAVELKTHGLLVAAEALLESVASGCRTNLAGGEGDNSREVLAVCLINLATIAIDRGAKNDVAAALELLDEAAKHAEALNDAARLGTIELNRGRACSLVGDIAGTRHGHQAALDWYRAAGASSTDLAWAARASASSLADAGQLSEAKRLQLEALQVFRDAGEQQEADKTLVGLVAVRAELGEEFSSEEIATLDGLVRQLPSEAALQLAGNVGNIVRSRGDLEHAARLFEWMRDLCRREGRRAGAAKAELSLAGVAREAGDLDEALTLTAAAQQALSDLGLWREVAHADHNTAVILDALANRSTPPQQALLREAATHALAAVASLDRFRHALPTAADRRALLLHTYPGLFSTAMRVCLRAGLLDECAALVERSRIQPVLSSRTGDDEGFTEPAPIAARAGVRAVGGIGAVVALAAEAERLVGASTRWIGWWRRDADLLRAVTGRDGVSIATTDYAQQPLELLADCRARTGDRELAAAAGDPRTAARLALWRAANGPLLDDPALAAALRDTFSASTRRQLQPACDRLRATGLDEILWPLARMLFGEPLLKTLAATSDRARFVVAPPPMFGDIPWALLPLAEPRGAQGCKTVSRLIDIADFVVGLPASLAAAGGKRAPRGARTLLIADPTGDLPWTRGLAIEAETRLGHGHAQASREQVLRALSERDWDILALAGHITPGRVDDPASTALLLAGEADQPAALTARQLGAAGAPPVCIVLGCDGAGAAVGAEWTGVATGLVWAGTTWVVTTSWPMLEDRHSATCDAELVTSVQRHGACEGLWQWQRLQCERWRENPADRAAAPYRWAGTIVTGSGSAAAT